MKRWIEKRGKRLRGMTTQEIVYRMREKLRLETERVRLDWNGSETAEEYLWHSFECFAGANGGSTVTGKNEFSFKRYIEQGPAQRFYLPEPQAERDRLQTFVEEYFPEWKENAIEEADRLCQHRFELLGLGEVRLGRDINWHQDPMTGRTWPRRFWADYDLVHETGAGDPKVILELNRHQHLPRLAKAYFLTGEESYARETVEQISSWIDQNPPGRGIHWHSSLDIGLRVISWLWTLFFLLPSESLHEDAARLFCHSLLAQLDHVHRYPSVFSSPNTHLLGEATALFIGGLVFPEHKGAPAWLETGASLLVDEMDKQVLGDGVHGELSSYYHCYTLDFYLQALVMADRNRFSFPDSVSQRLSRMMDFLLHLSRPDGSIPLLGDDDGGRALALTQTNYRSFTDALCTGAVLFRRPDFKHQARDFCEETFWMMGESAWQTYASLKSAPPPELSVFFPVAGYFIERSGWGEMDSHLVFDCGGMGIINGGHGHADALSVALFSGGKELLADPGTYTYNASAEWRNSFRSTRAHNTALVDEMDQSEPGETFRWRQQAQSRLLQQHILPDVEYIEGEHDGYRRLPQGVTHRRRLLYCKPDYWLIADDFRGQGEHTFDLYYHFGSEVELSFGGSDGIKPETEILARAPGAGLLLSLRVSAPLHAEIVRGETAPIQGWVSGRYGERTPAFTLRVTFKSAVPVAVLSLLVPLHPDPAQRISKQDWEVSELRGLKCSGETLACAVKHRSRTDFVILPIRDSEFETIDFMGCKMRGELFSLRTHRGVIRRLCAVHPRSLVCNEQDLLLDGTPQDFLCVRFDEAGRLAEQDEKGETVYVRDMRDCELRQR